MQEPMKPTRLAKKKRVKVKKNLTLNVEAGRIHEERSIQDLDPNPFEISARPAINIEVKKSRKRTKSNGLNKKLVI